MTKFGNDYIIQQINKIDHSISELKSYFEAEHKEQLQYIEAVIWMFMATYNDDSSKRWYCDSLNWCSYMVSKFNMQQLCF